MLNFDYDEFASPIGKICVLCKDDTLYHLDFVDCEDRMERLLKVRFKSWSTRARKNPAQIRERVNTYFAGNRQAFADLLLDPGGSDFQKKVWTELQNISFGKTINYTELAEAIAQSSAVRAVASANAKNPLAIIIPCHRVIAKNGALAGYAGGIGRKAWLLQHEKAL